MTTVEMIAISLAIVVVAMFVLANLLRGIRGYRTLYLPSEPWSWTVWFCDATEGMCRWAWPWLCVGLITFKVIYGIARVWGYRL